MMLSTVHTGRTLATLAVVSLGFGAGPASAHAPGAHVHGEAQASVVVADTALSITVNSAMYNITGFERAPQSPEEEARLAEAIAALEDGDTLFEANPAAGCALSSAVHSLPETAGETHPGPGVDDHDEDNPYRDLEATYEFTCASPAQLETIRFAFIERFENLEKVDVVLFVNDQQSAQALSRDTLTLALPDR